MEPPSLAVSTVESLAVSLAVKSSLCDGGDGGCTAVDVGGLGGVGGGCAVDDPGGDGGAVGGYGTIASPDAAAANVSIRRLHMLSCMWLQLVQSKVSCNYGQTLHVAWSLANYLVVTTH